MFDVLGQSEVEEIVSPHYAPLKACLSRATEKLNRSLKNILPTLRYTSVVGCLRDLLVGELGAEFSGNPDVEVHEVDDLALVPIDNKIVLRFHALNRNGVPSRNKTLRTKQFYEQDSAADLVGPRTNLVFGYEVEITDRITINDVHLLCPNGGGFAWKISIGGLDQADNVRYFPSGDSVDSVSETKISPAEGKENSIKGGDSSGEGG
ncbi:MAG: hypothetical protein M5R36_17515 [Deltaproteobacteria bacterium]|nr:hypothetical protein [Deltaproteobacteria bacterium]